MNTPTKKEVLFFVGLMVIIQIVGVLLFAAIWMRIIWISVTGSVLFYFAWSLFRLLQTSDMELVRYTNEQAEDSIKQVLNTMPLGIIRYNRETFEMIWVNPYTDYVYTAENLEVNAETVRLILKLADNKAQFMTIGEKQYYFYLFKSDGLIYFIDITNEQSMQQEVKNRQLVIGTISIDNYDDITENMDEKEVSILNSLTTTVISDWMRSQEVFGRRINRERYFFVTRYSSLEKMIETKFDIIDSFRKRMIENDTPLTLSLGIGYGMSEALEVGLVANNNLEIALVRGGDQVVVKEDIETSKPQYFGGKSASVVKRTRVRTRAMATALKGIMNDVDEVYIMGHRFPDMDAIGAAFGVLHLAKYFQKNAYVVLDDSQYITDVERSLEEIKQIPEMYDSIVSPDYVKMKRQKNSLLIMVDYNKPSLSISKDVYELFEKIVIIDHHRRSDDFPKNPLLSYIESGASSASELITELIQYQQYNHQVRLSRTEATLLMAGIVVDTKNFQVQTTSRTFDTASFLRSKGADSSKVQLLLSSDLSSYMDMNELISNNEFITETVLVACGSDDKVYDSVTLAKAADTILSFSGIEASFVIGKFKDGKVAISARSKQTMNVQTIMEKLGGGGHFNNAAMQRKDTSIQAMRNELIAVIHDDMSVIYEGD